MNASLSRILYSVSRCVPGGSLRRVIEFPFLAPFYHIVSDETVPHVDNLYTYRNTRQFKEDIDFFLKHSAPLTLAELLVHLKGDRRLSRQNFFLSLDDGLREIFDVVAPILKQKGVPATFFVNSATIDNKGMLYRHKASVLIDRLREFKDQVAIAAVTSLLGARGIHGSTIESSLLSVRYADQDLFDKVATLLEFDFQSYLAGRQPYVTSAQLKDLVSQGFTIGGHSIDHPFYPEIGLDEQLRQTGESVDAVTRAFDLDYKVFAFPFGDKGVSNRFFLEIRAKEMVDVLFGSSAYLVDEHYPLAVQRLGMEDQPHSAADNLRVAEVKFVVRLLTGKSGTRRTGS
jgi:peptidoglycan/xylan/chitin deacetylase (PgdA/CDA1 family)